MWQKAERLFDVFADNDVIFRFRVFQDF
jgi:hypothetical protein